ncbi:MAG: ABC transporter substrate-binding protein [Candidatus Tectimicrobiota bacterium]
MRRVWLGIVLLWSGLLLLAGPARSEVLPGATVEERAINGAKEYVKKHALKDPSLTMLMSPLFKPAMPTFAKQWEEHTGVKLKWVESGYTDIPARMMAEAVAKTGDYDIFNQFPYVVPDAVGVGAILPLDEYAAKGQPDFSGIEAPLRAQQTYNGKLYFFLLDGDQLLVALRKDILDLPGAKEEFQSRYGWEPGCPETTAQWEQLAEFFQAKKGQTRWGKTFDQDLYGALGYRSINFSYRHFLVYFASLLFDKEMRPRINTPHGIRAIADFTSIMKYMPPEIQGWGTPQIYPFWASGQAFSVMAFPSIVGFGNTNAESKIKGQQLSCVIPGVPLNGTTVRRSPQAAGTGYMVSRSSKHPELAYYFLQWLTGPTKGDEAIAHPQGFWDPMRLSNRSNEAILAKFGAPFVEVTLENTKYVTSLLMLPGNAEYNNIFDTNVALVMQGNATPEEAAKKIEEGWNRVTDELGRAEQIKLWRSGVESGLYLDTF